MTPSKAGLGMLSPLNKGEATCDPTPPGLDRPSLTRSPRPRPNPRTKRAGRCDRRSLLAQDGSTWSRQLVPSRTCCCRATLPLVPRRCVFPVMGPFRSATMARWPTSHSSSRELKSGDPKTAEELLPMVYDELRQLAADKLTRDGVNKPIREGVRSTGTLGKTQVSTHES
jgi:hypothetical protein